MVFLKIFIGILALFLGWLFLFRKDLVYKANHWIRTTVFDDQLALYSGQRIASLLLILGCVALISGLDNSFYLEMLKPYQTSRQLNRVRNEFERKHYAHAIQKGQEYLVRKPNDVEVMGLVALSYYMNGDLKNAQSMVSQMMKIEPKSTLLKILPSDLLKGQKKRAQKRI